MKEQIILVEGLLLKRYEDKLVVVSDETDRKKASNETFRNKETLRRAGFQWNAYLNAWVIHQAKLPQAQQVLQGINKKPLERFIDKVEEIPEFIRNADNLSKKEELAGKLEKFIADLSTAVDEAATSAAVKEYLEFNARFRQYSWYNTLLIYLQKPNATQVAGYVKWREEFHRGVKKDSAITILAPMGEKKSKEKPTTSTGVTSNPSSTEPETEPNTGDEPETEKGTPITQRRFIAVRVFDISDTYPLDAKGEVPPQPKWHGSDEPHAKAEELFEVAKEVADEMGIKLTQDTARGDEQGWAKGDHINITSTVGGVNKAATVIHEIAHELLHFKRTSPFYIGDEGEEEPGKPNAAKSKIPMNKETMELQAESVSYVVIRYYGLPAEHQATYVALWKGNKEAVQKNLDVIKKAAYFIIDKIDEVQKEKQKTASVTTTESSPMFKHLGGNQFKLNQ